MAEEKDLGPINGFQWRHFGAEYKGTDFDYLGQGFDQISKLIQELKANPHSKRMVVSAWNPSSQKQMAIPPCPFAFECLIYGEKLNLVFFQRSVDLMLGFPFDVASHALLLHLLAKETGLVPGKLVGYFGNMEIYENHLGGARALLNREPLSELPSIEIQDFNSIFKWEYTDAKIVNYSSHPKMEFEIAV